MSSHPLLEARDISKSFPGVQALSEVDFVVAPGEVHALVGENGAGKSTLSRSSPASTSPTRGRCWSMAAGSDRQPGRCRALGISVIHQEIVLVPELDVASNLLLGDPPHARPGLASPNSASSTGRPFKRATNTWSASLRHRSPYSSWLARRFRAQLVLIARGFTHRCGCSSSTSRRRHSPTSARNCSRASTDRHRDWSV